MSQRAWASTFGRPNRIREQVNLEEVDRLWVSGIDDFAAVLTHLSLGVLRPHGRGSMQDYNRLVLLISSAPTRYERQSPADPSICVGAVFARTAREAGMVRARPVVSPGRRREPVKSLEALGRIWQSIWILDSDWMRDSPWPSSSAPPPGKVQSPQA